MYYLENEIENMKNEILKKDDELIDINTILMKLDQYEIKEKIENNENNYWITRNLNILENSINFNLFNDKYDYYDFFDIKLNFIPIYYHYCHEYTINEYYSIGYYEYKSYAFLNIDDLIEYIINEYKTLYNFQHIKEINIDDINIIFDDLKKYYDEYIDYYSYDEITYYIENYEKIIENDYLYLSTYSINSYDEFVDEIIKDLINNFLDDEIKELLTYKNFKIQYDEKLINYFNNLYYDEIDENEIINLIFIEIKDKYNDYFRRYYDLSNFINIYVELYDKINEKYYEFKDDEYDEIDEKIKELTTFKLINNENNEIIYENDDLYEIFENIKDENIDFLNVRINNTSFENILKHIINFNDEIKLYQLYNSLYNYDNNYYFNKSIHNNLNDLIYILILEEITLKQFIDELKEFNKNDKYFIIKNDEYSIYSTNNLNKELDHDDLIQFILNNNNEILDEINEIYYDELINYSSLKTL